MLLRSGGSAGAIHSSVTDVVYEQGHNSKSERARTDAQLEFELPTRCIRRGPRRCGVGTVDGDRLRYRDALGWKPSLARGVSGRGLLGCRGVSP